MLPFARQTLPLARCSVALLNYRLTTPDDPLRHPAHCTDVLHALDFLHTPPPLLAGTYDPTQIHLAGHSCGAHILASLFMTHANDAFPSPSPDLASHVRSISLSEGLYDLDLLLLSFPSYRRFFIVDAFGDHASYRPFSPAFYPATLNPACRWLIIHSKGDRLVDLPQSNAMLAALQLISAPVQSDFTSLEADHDQILVSEAYATIILRFVLS